ncbi:topoisomerase DNA-binding C4 zinc finger domain-containing protein [Sphingomonas sp. RT2P30]|uniref:topoisomerase DNA-binding C4 zinc finger domain-containing protein n=1 Tax=Parasphingomonas halimpatiens TaxID=3096162 RepID=UPI003FA69E54
MDHAPHHERQLRCHRFPLCEGYIDLSASPAPVIRPPYIPRATTARTYSPRSPPNPPPGTSCPLCSATMVIRKARHGRFRGRQFYGCSQYPACLGTRPKG